MIPPQIEIALTPLKELGLDLSSSKI